MIVIIDFGSQSTHLISRRLREISIPSIVVEPEEFFDEIKTVELAGIILSGGPQSVYDADAPRIDLSIYDLGRPILGICYGLQYIAHTLGGKVQPASQKEMGPATLIKLKNSPLFKLTEETCIPEESIAWMSHGDEVIQLPAGFETLAKTTTTKHAAFANQRRSIYGVQFHPELIHTQFGIQFLCNFASICGLKPKEQSINKELVANLIADIKESIGQAKVISAISGGVDSAIATLLVHEAIGKRLIPVYIDSGLMREGETDALEEVFKKHYKMPIKIVHAKADFLERLAGVKDPEQKRKIIGKAFIDVFEKEARHIEADYLVQGTIWPDVIESAGSKHSRLIKSHHNVGGLPENMQLKLIEPIRNFYKDEVRAIGKYLGLGDAIVHRQPFPGPGLAIRIIGEVTDYKLNILRKADKIVQQEVEKYHNRLWQVFAVFTGIQSTGIGGDYRSYGECIAIRAVESEDAMSAHWAPLPYDLLNRLSTRITSEVAEVNRVVFDITNKPPATIEWE